MLHATSWPGTTEQYAHILTSLLGHLLAHPDRFARPFTTTELLHLVSAPNPRTTE
ncbi:hypothetical protein AB0C96_27880 [Streptomyces sp. NPDC048506]|uniref:hypothetical protein n=1 Tax=Streptomyces sp. NPDC048506 TaxID=3155028 RepID=UPI0034237AAD